MEQISNYIKKELCKKNKYDKKVFDEIHQKVIEEYEKINSQNEEKVWNHLKEMIDIEISKLKPKSKFLFILIISLILFGISSIECILLSVDFVYILPELVIVDVILFCVLIYASFIKKNKSLWNLFLILFIVVWLASFFCIGISELKMWGGNPDTKIITNFIFPCVYRNVKYVYKMYVLGNQISSSIGIYFNWIVSLILSIVFLVLYHREVKNKKAD